MKKLKSLKLNQLSKAELNQREMKYLLGGGADSSYCYCDSGTANMNANADYGYTESADDGNDDNNYQNNCICDPSIPNDTATVRAV